VGLAVALGGALGVAGILVAALFGRPILTLLFRPEYGEQSGILVRLMIAGTLTFMASGLGFVVTAARSLRPQIPVLVVTALAGAGTSAWLIPRYGLSGAADAAIASTFVQFVGTFAIVLKIDRQLHRDAQMTVSPEPASLGLRSLKVETT
jgi:O-antigen/teichoic acid export membrane protein